MRTFEPLWWAVFSAGGTLAAFLFPILVFITGAAVPAGLISIDGLYALVQQPAVRGVLFVAIALPLFHAAHRVRHTLVDLGLRRYERELKLLCYGGAAVGTLAAAFVLAL